MHHNFTLHPYIRYNKNILLSYYRHCCPVQIIIAALLQALQLRQASFLVRLRSCGVSTLVCNLFTLLEQANKKNCHPVFFLVRGGVLGVCGWVLPYIVLQLERLTKGHHQASATAVDTLAGVSQFVVNG